MRYFLILLMVLLPLHAQKEIVIDLTQQKAYALDDGYIVFEGRISSGKKGRETPEGTYRILQKKRKHRSNLWPKPNGGAKMPYMLRLTNTGIAIHLGNTSRRAASHGCIRTQNGFAQRLYKWARVGTLVRVNGNAFNYDYVIQSGSKYGLEYGVIDFHN